jgi:N-carbamoylputrescine amidase
VRAAAVQFKAIKGDRDATLARLVPWVTTATRDADLVVLPEMCVSGYVFPTRESAAAVAETADGPTFRALSPLARAAQCWLVAGFPEVAADKLFNSAMVISPKGQVEFVYRKTLLYAADYPWACEGDSGYQAFDCPFGRFTVGICMDMNHDRFIDAVSALEADAVAFPTNWIDEGIEVHRYWRERMAGTGAALIAANSYGPEDGTAFSGRSAILGKSGEVLAVGPYRGDCVIRATIG